MVVKALHIIGVGDRFILGGTHIFCPFCPNHEYMPGSPPALKISLSGGGGGGPPPRSTPGLVYFSFPVLGIGLS